MATACYCIVNIVENHCGTRSPSIVRQGVDRAEHGLAAIKIDGVDAYEFESVPLGDPVPTSAGDEAVAEMAKEDPEEATVEDQHAKASGKSKKKNKTSQRRVLEKGDSADEEAAEECDNLANDSSIETDEDVLYDAHQDDTAVIPTTPTCAPAGFKFRSKPKRMNVTKWIDRRVFWFIEHTASKKPGWIISKIKGGPSTPSEGRSGITMRLFSERRLDKQTPSQLAGKDNIMSVAFSLSNYGEHWFLLMDEKDEESSDSECDVKSSASSSSSADGSSESSEAEDANPSSDED